MSDADDDAGQKRQGGPLAGERLAVARRAHDISIRDVAKELHLDEAKVQALEDNRFEVLGAPVFAKGYLRKYAELVSVPIDDILADYYRLNRSVGAPPLVGLRGRPAADFTALGWIAGAVVLLAAVLVSFWWFNRPPAEPGGTGSVPVPSTAGEDAAPDSAPAAANSGMQPAPETGGNDEPAPDAGVPGQSEPQAADADIAGSETPQSAPVEAPVRLELRFSGECWTEVTDADGRRLFFGLGTNGRRVAVNGRPPLRVLIGDIENVSLRVDDADFPIPAADRRGNTARLTIGGT